MQWTRPKSVRQIGEIPGRGRIYMEDYVIRFVTSFHTTEDEVNALFTYLSEASVKKE